MKKRKLTALFLAAFMGLSAPVGVQAGVSYQDAEKAALADALKPFISSYSQQLSVYDDAMKGSRADISLDLHDTGKALLSMLVPADISWLNNLQIIGDVGISDTQLSEIYNVNLNGSKICTLEIYMDTASMVTYVRIPELADGYIKAPFEPTEDTEDGSDIDTKAFLSGYMKALPNLPNYLPSPEDLNTLVDRYASILISHTQETSSKTETLSAASVNQECTVLDAELAGNDAISAYEEILNSAKKDDELKSIIENIEKMSPESGISYDVILKKIDSLLEDISDEPADSDSEPLMTSRIWLDNENTITGRQLILKDGEEDTLNLTWKAPSSENTCGYNFLLEADEESFEISGTGTLNGSLLDGYYELYYNNTPTAAIKVSGYDTESMEKGCLNGTYSFSIHPEADKDISQSLGNFSADISFTGDSTNGGAVLTVASASVPMVSLSVLSSLSDDSVEFLDLDSIEKIYDVDSDVDMDAFASAMTLDTIMENLTAAGMPENFIEDLMASAAESAYESDSIPEAEPQSEAESDAESLLEPAA